MESPEAVENDVFASAATAVAIELSPAAPVPAVSVDAESPEARAIVPAVVPLGSKKSPPAAPDGLYAEFTAVTSWLARLSRLSRRVWIAPVEEVIAPWMEPAPRPSAVAGCPPVTTP